MPHVVPFAQLLSETPKEAIIDARGGKREVREPRDVELEEGEDEWRVNPGVGEAQVGEVVHAAEGVEERAEPGEGDGEW